MTATTITGEELEADLVGREAVVSLASAPTEDSTPMSTPVLIILISAGVVIAVGICVACLILRKKRIALNGGGSISKSKKEEEAQKAVDKFLQTSLKKKTSETQKKFVGLEEQESVSGRSFGAGLDTQAPALVPDEEKDKRSFAALSDDDKDKRSSFGKNSILSPDKNKSIVGSHRTGSQKPKVVPKVQPDDKDIMQ